MFFEYQGQKPGRPICKNWKKKLITEAKENLYIKKIKGFTVDQPLFTANALINLDRLKIN